MRIIRHYQEQDKPVLTEMERIEGIEESGMCFEDNPTMVLEDDKKVIGFFTLRKQHNFPMLQHFCISREHRSPKNARLLIKSFKEVCKQLKFNKVIIPSMDKKLEKMIQYYFKTKPYAFLENKTFFLVKLF